MDHKYCVKKPLITEELAVEAFVIRKVQIAAPVTAKRGYVTA